MGAIRFSALNAVCDVLDCQLGDLLEYQEDEEHEGDVTDKKNKI